MTDQTTNERLARLEAEVTAFRLARTRRPAWLPRLASTRQRVLAALLMVLLVTMSVTAGVYASDRFSDVPTSHFAHGDINAIAAAGITAGCGGTNYCPDQDVTRGQMAAFLHRALGRAGRTHVSTATLGTTPVAVTSVGLTVPGATGSTATTNGFVLVNAAATPNVGTGCPCGVAMRVSDPVSSQASWYHVEVVSNQAFGYSGNIAVDYLFPVSALPGTVRQFNVDAYVFSGTGDVAMFVDATALWVPFGSTGTSTLNADVQNIQQEIGGR